MTTQVTTEQRRCPSCGGPVEALEAPPELTGRWRGVLERITPLCDECSARVEREDREDERQRLRDQALIRVRASGLPRELRGLSWDDFDVDEPGRRKAVAAARSWAKLEGPKGLVVCGPVGTGKTRLAATAAYERIFRGDPLRWASVPLLLARATTDAGREQATEVLTDGHRGIVLDDITKIGSSRWAASQLYAAIDARITEGSALLLTSNRPPSRLAEALGEEHGQAIASRIAECCRVVALAGRDRRLDQELE